VAGGGVVEIVFAGPIWRGEEAGAVLKFGFECKDLLEQEIVSDPGKAVVFAVSVVKATARAAAGTEADIADEDRAETILFGDDVEMPEMAILCETSDIALNWFGPVDGVGTCTAYEDELRVVNFNGPHKERRAVVQDGGGKEFPALIVGENFCWRGPTDAV